MSPFRNLQLVLCQYRPRFRTDPDSPIPTVDVLLSKRLTSLLALILAIPPIPPTQHLQVALLLRFTSAAREWIAGYPLQWPSGYAAAPDSESTSVLTPEEQAQNTITLLLEFLQKLDDGWRRVLVAQASGETREKLPRDTSPVSPLTVTEKYVKSLTNTTLRLM